MKREADNKRNLRQRIGFPDFEIEFADPEEFAPLDENAEKLLSLMRELAYPITLKQLVKYSQLPENILYQSTILLKFHDLIKTINDSKGREYFQLTERGKSTLGK